MQTVFGMNFVHCWFQCELCFRSICAYSRVVSQSVCTVTVLAFLCLNNRIGSKNLGKR